MVLGVVAVEEFRRRISEIFADFVDCVAVDGKG